MNTKSWSNLENEVISKGLCCYCGTCAGICPNHAITTKQEHIGLQGKCSSCGRCVRVCPGKSFDYGEFNDFVFGTCNTKDNFYIGNYLNIYVGHAVENSVRYKAGSGGVIGAILSTLLENKVIDGALVLSSKKGLNHKSEIGIARTKDEIIQSLQSKYYRYPSNKILQELKGLEGKFAFVGTPCQIHGLRKAAKYDPHTVDNISLYIGLFCGFNLNFAATEFLIKKLRMSPENIIKLEYRSFVNSGFMVEDNLNNQRGISKHGYTFVNLAFSPKRCWQCPDFTSEFADISVGDAWEKNQGSNKWSRVITRTPAGEEALNLCLKASKIAVENSSQDVLFKCQRHLFEHKKKWLWVRRSLFFNNPDFGLTKPHLSVRDYVFGIIFMGTYVFWGSCLGKYLLNVLPITKVANVSERLRDFIKNKAGSK